MHSNIYGGSIGDTTRKPSAAVWTGFVPNCDFEFFDDFAYFPTGKYEATQATSGSFDLSDGHGGIVIADTGAAVANQGINVQLGGSSAGEIVAPSAGRKIFFEARIKLVTAYGDVFVGLCETDTSIVASHAMTSNYYFGFKSLTGNGVVLACAKNNSTEATNSINGGSALSLDTWYKLGFVINGLSDARIFLDGVEQGQSTKFTSTHIPATDLRLSFVMQCYTTTRAYMHVDWVRIGVIE